MTLVFLEEMSYEFGHAWTICRPVHKLVRGKFVFMSLSQRPESTAELKYDKISAHH